MKEVPIAVKLAGPGLMFLATACGSAATAESTPTATLLPTPTMELAPTPTPREIRVTPSPEQTAASLRPCSLTKIENLKKVLERHTTPLLLDKYDGGFFDTLVRSDDMSVKNFMDNHRTTEFTPGWELPMHQGVLRANFTGSIACTPTDDFSRVDLLHFGGVDFLPEDLVGDAGSRIKVIRPDKLQHAARAMFNLPDDVRWAIVNKPERRGGDLIGLRGLSISPTGTLTEIKIDQIGWVRLTVSVADWRLFPVIP